MTRTFAVALLLMVPSIAVPQQLPETSRPAIEEGLPPTSLYNLPSMPVGADDLLGISVYGSPDLSRTVRVSSDGTIRLPLVTQKISVKGMLPSEIETAIAQELKKDQILVDPIVTVSVAEYKSRPISVAGAVRSPLIFQALPNTTLLDALTRAQGLSEDAGSEIIVTHHKAGPNGEVTAVNQRIPVKGLYDQANALNNIRLEGGDAVRVPAAGKVFVVGDVKHPGAFSVHNTDTLTVLKAIALSEGLAQFAGKTAYIYRREGGAQGQDGIPIELSKIMDRKSPDVPLQQNDILYIPDNKGRRMTLGALEKTLLIGGGIGTALVYAGVR